MDQVTSAGVDVDVVLSAALQSTREAWGITRGRTIVAVNDELCRLTGFAREELVGAKMPFPFWDSEALSELEELSHRVTDTDGGADYELMIVRRDGARVPVSCSARPAHGLDGEIVAFVTSMRDLSLERHQETQLRLLADTDALTGITNRRGFEARMVAWMERPRPMTLALLDLDSFKLINDRLGHGVGDQVLRDAAAAWQGELRPDDLIARIGGDEFVIVLPGCPIELADVVVARLRQVLPPGIGCSFGLAEWDGSAPLDALLEDADRALYEDKRRATPQELDDPDRVAAVAAVHAELDAHRERLDALVRTVQELLDAPKAFVSLVGETSMCVASGIGLPDGLPDEIPFELSFCQRTVVGGRPLVVADMFTHDTLRMHPMVLNGEVRAYAGVPFADADGFTVGAICAVDQVPRPWTPDDVATLRTVAARAAAIVADRPAQLP